jgi:hypothetical protein
VKTLFHEEANKMTSILTQKQMAAIRGFVNSPTKSEGLIMCQNCFLSELPGVVFGVVTIIWIVGTLGLLNR